MAAEHTKQDRVWQTIDRERRRDRTLRIISTIAWGLTFVALLIYASMVVSEMSQLRRLAATGVVNEREVLQAAMPLVAVVGVLSLLIATLCTVGIFLRLRTANLMEVQLRLADLERMLAGNAE